MHGRMGWQMAGSHNRYISKQMEVKDFCYNPHDAMLPCRHVVMPPVMCVPAMVIFLSFSLFCAICFMLTRVKGDAGWLAGLYDGMLKAVDAPTTT